MNRRGEQSNRDQGESSVQDADSELESRRRGRQDTRRGNVGRAKLSRRHSAAETKGARSGDERVEETRGERGGDDTEETRGERGQSEGEGVRTLDEQILVMSCAWRALYVLGWLGLFLSSPRGFSLGVAGSAAEDLPVEK